jgi:Indole-3-glycerol phosphate synthase
MILDSIFENRRKQVAAQKAQKPAARIEREAEAYAATHPARDFAKALRGEGLSVIAEVKKASPSKGLIRADFYPVEIAEQYERAGAAAISVLTEESYFQGSAAYLTAIRQAVALPLLRKDFIFDEWQICEARLIGADAVLLIAAMLDTQTLERLRKYAEELGLAALVETHSEKEAESAIRAGTSIFGVNNRNLLDFAVDTGTACRLAPLLPPGAVFVAESGVRTAQDAQKMRAAGADAILVGEALMRAPSIAEKLAELRVS